MNKYLVEVGILYPKEGPAQLHLSYGPLRYMVMQKIGEILCDITKHWFCMTRIVSYFETYGWKKLETFSIEITDDQINEFKTVAGWHIWDDEEDDGSQQEESI